MRHIAYVEAVPLGFAGLQVHVRNIRTGADRMVYRAVSGGANAARVTRPSYIASPEAFLWARTNNGSGRGNRLVRYTLRGSKLAYAQGNSALQLDRLGGRHARHGDGVLARRRRGHGALLGRGAPLLLRRA